MPGARVVQEVALPDRLDEQLVVGLAALRAGSGRRQRAQTAGSVRVRIGGRDGGRERSSLLAQERREPAQGAHENGRLTPPPPRTRQPPPRPCARGAPARGRGLETMP